MTSKCAGILIVIGICSINNAFATLDPYDRSKDIRPSTLKEIENGRKDWGIDGALGVGLTRGNANLTSTSVAVDSFKRIGDYSGYLLGDAYYADYNGIRIRDQGSILARVDDKISENWRIFAVTSHAYNQYIHLDYRGTVGSGILYRLNFGAFRSGFSAAPTYEYETYSTGATRSLMRISFRYLARAEISDTASMGLDFFYIPAVIDISNYRMYLSVSLENQLYKKFLGLKLAYNAEYFSNPIPGVLNLDTNFSTSLVFHVGE